MHTNNQRERLITGESLILTLNKSVGTFKIGDCIEDYLDFPHEISHLYEDNIISDDVYEFPDIGIEVIVPVGQKIITTIRCKKYCFWNGENIIGMLFKTFKEKYNLPDVHAEKFIIPGALSLKKYDFTEGESSNIDLVVWTYRNRIMKVDVWDLDGDFVCSSDFAANHTNDTASMIHSTKQSRIITSEMLILTLKKSVGTFKIGDSIDNYLDIPHDISHLYEENVISDDVYEFTDIGIKLTLPVGEKIITDICCEKYCFWNGENIIGMPFKTFKEKFNLPNVPAEQYFIPGIMYQRLYRFTSGDADDIDLLVWTYRNKIVTVIVCNYDD